MGLLPLIYGDTPNVGRISLHPVTRITEKAPGIPKVHVRVLQEYKTNIKETHTRTHTYVLKCVHQTTRN